MADEVVHVLRGCPRVHLILVPSRFCRIPGQSNLLRDQMSGTAQKDDNLISNDGEGAAQALLSQSRDAGGSGVPQGVSQHSANISRVTSFRSVVLHQLYI